MDHLHSLLLSCGRFLLGTWRPLQFLRGLQCLRSGGSDIGCRPWPRAQICVARTRERWDRNMDVFPIDIPSVPRSGERDLQLATREQSVRLCDDWRLMTG